MKTHDDKAKAIDRVEELVGHGLHEAQTPEVLAHALFAELRGALADGRSAGVLPRRKAQQRVEEQIGEISAGAFKNAVKSVTAALGRCRMSTRPLSLISDDGEGVACIEESIDGAPHLVFVRGLRNENRPTLLELAAEFRPLPVTPEVTA